MNKGNKRKRKDINELTAGYEKFIKGKELNKTGQELFNSVVKKTVTKKPKR